MCCPLNIPPHTHTPSLPRGSRGGAKYLGSFPEDQPGSADRPGRDRMGWEAVGAERGTSISLPNDKLTLCKMYVRSRRNQLIKSLAAPSSFLWPSLATQTERKRRAPAERCENREKSAAGEGFKGHMVFMCNNSGFRSAPGPDKNKLINKYTTTGMRPPFFSEHVKGFHTHACFKNAQVHWPIPTLETAGEETDVRSKQPWKNILNTPGGKTAFPKNELWSQSRKKWLEVMDDVVSLKS